MASFKISHPYIMAYNKNISKNIRTDILLSKLSDGWFDYKSRIETFCLIARQHNLGLTIFATMTFMVIRAIKLLLYKMRRQVYHKRYFIEKMLRWILIFYIQVYCPIYRKYTDFTWNTKFVILGNWSINIVVLKVLFKFSSLQSFIYRSANVFSLVHKFLIFDFCKVSLMLSFFLLDKRRNDYL